MNRGQYGLLQQNLTSPIRDDILLPSQTRSEVFMNKSSLLLIVLLSFFLAAPQTFAADSNCKPLYGGGVTKEQACGKQTTPQARPNPTTRPLSNINKPQPTSPQRNASKGGLPVSSPTQTKTTPNTGPEVLGALVLPMAAGLGYYLRKKY